MGGVITLLITIVGAHFVGILSAKVPYINQFHSPYDSAQFESYLRPKSLGEAGWIPDAAYEVVRLW